MSQSDFVSRGQALVTSGQYQEAVKVCRLGLLGRPTTVEGRIVLGMALLALKRYDEVLAEMRVALELDHASVGAQILKGEALLAKGDAVAAVEQLAKIQALVPADQQRLAKVLGDARRQAGRPAALGASHPSVGFVGNRDEGTKNYPGPHGRADDEDTEPKDDESGFTKPTAIARSKGKQGMFREGHVPPDSVLAVGDRSGTVEVDPDRDGIELSGDEDFGDVAAPPGKMARTHPPLAAAPVGCTRHGQARIARCEGRQASEPTRQAQGGAVVGRARR